jgi:apolipoprotein N-acyltransferase
MRKPHLICANTGFSADIDRFGNIRSVGPRRNTDVIVAEIHKSNSLSVYRGIGDSVPFVFGVILVFVALVGRFTTIGIENSVARG